MGFRLGSGRWEDPATDLDAVTATGASTGFRAAGAESIRIVITSASVTTGGTLKIQGNTRADGGGDWFDIDSEAVSSNAVVRYDYTIPDIFPLIRTNLTARTDGTYTTTYQRLR